MTPPAARKLEAPQFVAPLTPINVPIDRCTVPREQAERRILIQRNGALGDILMGTTILPAIRKRWPNAHITWIVEHTDRGAIEANPLVDELIIWDSLYWKRMVRRLAYLPWISQMLAFRRQLRERQYDVFISFQPEEWPLLALGTGAPLRIGIFDTFRQYYSNRKTSRNTRFYDHAYTHTVLPDHRIDQYLLTLDALELPKPTEKRMLLGHTADDAEAIARWLVTQAIGENERFVVIVPQASWRTKCWPAERFVALGDALADRGLRVILSGSPKEAEAIHAIGKQMRIAPSIIAGQVTFRQLAALLDRAALLVSGDTGPMHAATALGVPRVALFGATSPKSYGPLTGPGLVLHHPVPCGPCEKKTCPNTGDDFEKCMRLLTVDEVTDACFALLDANRN